MNSIETPGESTRDIEPAGQVGDSADLVQGELVEPELIEIPLEVDELGDGFRLDRYLVRRFGRLSRHRVQRMIDQARVTCVDTGVALTRKAARVRKGQRLLIQRPAPPEPAVVVAAPHTK